MAEFSTAEIVVKSIFMSVFTLLAIIGNILVCIAIRKYKRLMTMTNYYVFNLAIADLLYGLTGMPLLLITTVAGKWILGPALCQLSGTLQTLFVLVSIWTLCLIGINRYVAVAKHASYKSIYRKKRVFISIGIVWFAASLVSVSPHFGWSSIRQGDSFCTINGKDDISYSVFVILFAYIAPLLVLSCLYTKIFFLLREHEKKMMEMKGLRSKANTESDYDSIELSAVSKINSMTKGENIHDVRLSNSGIELLRHTNIEADVAPDNRIPLGSSSSGNGGEIESNAYNAIDQRENEDEVSGQVTGTGKDVILESAVEKNGYLDVSTRHDFTDESALAPDRTSSSAIHLIYDAKQTVPNTPPTNTTNEGVMQPRKGRTLSGIANALKLRRSTTTKKIKKFRLEARITKMLFVVVAVFFVCWTPLVVGTILYAVNAEPKNFNLLSLGFVIASMNSICNPIIYAFMNDSFRKAFKDLFSGCKGFTEEPQTES